MQEVQTGENQILPGKWQEAFPVIAGYHGRIGCLHSTAAHIGERVMDIRGRNPAVNPVYPDGIHETGFHGIKQARIRIGTVFQKRMHAVLHIQNPLTVSGDPGP